MTLKDLLERFSGVDDWNNSSTCECSINVTDPDAPNGVVYIPSPAHCPSKLEFREIENFSFEIFEDGHLLVVNLKPTQYTTVCIYCDSTGQFSERECEKDNLVDIDFPDHIVHAWYKYHTSTEKTYDAWLDTFIADDVDGLYDFAKKHGFEWKRKQKQFLVRVVCEYEVFVNATNGDDAEVEALETYLEKSHGIPEETTAEIIDSYEV